MIISLAQEPSVSLGPLRLSPATREISHTDGRREVVEPRVMQVLLALAKADGAIVTRDQLVQSCWAGRVVGEDAINRVISRLRKTADGIGSGVFRVETVTRVGYRLVSNVRLEASVAGPRRQTSGLQAPPRPGRRAVWALAAAVLLVAAGAGLWWSVHNPSPAALVHVQSRTPQLTILPFIPLTPDLSPALVEQTREEIVAAFGLTSFVDIVTAPSRGAPKPLAWTLSGTVARVGTDLHFVMHLTHDTTGKIVWSAAIDRPYGASGQGLKSLAATLEEILATSLTAAASYHGKAELPDATLALFIQWSQDTVLPVGHYRHGEEELRRAVALTPDFARGWSWLAGALGATATASDDPTDAAAARTAAPAVIATALRFQPDDAVALMARAKTIAPQDFKARDAAFLAATSVPTSEAGVEHSAYSVFLMNVGRLAEAVRQADIGYELDPLDPSFMNRYARALSLTGQTALAGKVIDQTLLAWPQDDSPRDLRIRSALWTHDYAAAIATLQADSHAPPVVREAMLRTLTALRAGDRAGQNAAARELIALAGNPATARPFAVSALGALGRDREAVVAAERWIGSRDAMAADILFDPTLNAARRTPEFAALVGKIGLVDYWRSSGHLPDFCAEAGPPELCATLKR